MQQHLVTYLLVWMLTLPGFLPLPLRPHMSKSVVSIGAYRESYQDLDYFLVLRPFPVTKMRVLMPVNWDLGYALKNRWELGLLSQN